MAGKSKKKRALGEEKGIFRQRKRQIWVLYLSVKRKKELNFHAFWPISGHLWDYFMELTA